MMSTAIQMCVLPMYESLDRRSVPRFRRIIIVSFSLLFLLFVGFQTIALLVFGPGVSSNVLDALPQDAAGYVARIGMVVVIVGVYPIMVYPMISPIRASEKFGGARGGHIATVVIVAAAMVCAFFIDNLGVMN